MRTPRSGGWAIRERWPIVRPFVLALLGTVTGLLVVLAMWMRPQASMSTSQIAAIVASVEASATPTPEVASSVYQAILPSLVYIQTVGNQAQADGEGIGSGVVINSDGSILTANHVIDGARAITVIFADGTHASAHVAATQPDQDLAVLHADSGPQVIVPAVLGGGVQVGDLAFAVGNPLGFADSLTAGVVSGLDRTLPSRQSGQTLHGLIQFDAAVNPGSSGGPLLNRNGQVVGIVDALANVSNQPSFSGLGFAIPLSAAGGGLGGPPR